MEVDPQNSTEVAKPIFVTKSVFAQSLGLDPRRVRKVADAVVMLGSKKLEVYRPLPAEMASSYKELSQALFAK